MSALIFISHNFKDKAIVEPLAVKLMGIYGQDNVFYDSWSIQPGDGLIDKMNSGLEKCRFFFFFISQNSLSSKMVALEWQNIIIRATHGNVKLIPIRLDNSTMPAILLQTIYLDLYTNGLDVTLRQMVDVIEGRNTYKQETKSFSNLYFSTYQKEKELIIEIQAKYYMEPKSNYLVLLNNQENEVTVQPLESGMSRNGFNKNVELNTGLITNGWFIGVSEATVPAFPFRIKITAKTQSPISFVGVLHQETEKNWIGIQRK